MARNKQSSETALTVFPWSYRQEYRGLESDLPTLHEGEAFFTTDTFKLYYGTDAGNIWKTLRLEQAGQREVHLQS